MTEIEIQDSIKTNILPKDELDSLWSTIFGFLPLLVLLIITKDNIICFVANILVILYVIFLKLNEKKLKVINSPLTRDQNIILIKKISKDENWLPKTVTDGYYEYYIPFLFGKPGHKLIILLSENKLFFNLRNVGSSKGRNPYLFGIDTIKERRIISLFKNLPDIPLKSKTPTNF